MKIKIESDGTLENTKFINPDTNEVITSIVDLQFAVDVNKQPRVRVTFDLPVTNYMMELPIVI